MSRAQSGFRVSTLEPARAAESLNRHIFGFEPKKRVAMTQGPIVAVGVMHDLQPLLRLARQSLPRLAHHNPAWLDSLGRTKTRWLN